ncbi:MAG: TerB family tellurite resistance protein [Gammaproteobacteria bacterium]|nr:TerB family tellurite resistance protein [Gammaproteobacteria bacterium]
MIEHFKQFFDKYLSSDDKSPDNQEHKLHLATAALLIEMMRVDDHSKPEEMSALAAGIRHTFGLSEQETTELIQLAEEEAQDAACYHAFTSLINNGFSRQQKNRVVEMLWEIAYADNELEMYEEHLVRKISDLLYVRHSDFIRAKHQVLERLGLD